MVNTMAVTPEQWAAVAADLGTTIGDMNGQIAELDDRDDVGKAERLVKLPNTKFDRDLDPLSLGQWVILRSSPTYRYIASTILPNRHWIVTIWQGVNGDGDEPPIVMHTAVFHLDDPDRRDLPKPLVEIDHQNEPEARVAHALLVRRYCRP
jgi:hypothetical protein